MTLSELSVLLGPPGRCQIDAPVPSRRVTVRATWACGCRADGATFRDLLPRLCGTHVGEARRPIPAG